MTCYEELKARGLIAQVTNEEEISKMINEGKAVFYIGFDTTPASLPRRIVQGCSISPSPPPPIPSTWATSWPFA